MFKLNPILKNEFLRTPAFVDKHQFPGSDYKNHDIK